MAFDDPRRLARFSRMKSFYEQIGGEAGVTALVKAFLKALESERSAPLRACYREDLSYYATRMTAFLSGWLGGPMQYPGHFGLPLIVEKHHSFPINHELAILWLECMRDALRETVKEESLRLSLEGAFWQMADYLRQIATSDSLRA